MTTAHHALTAQASDAAIDTACRMLRLPTMRAQAADTLDPAGHDAIFYAGGHGTMWDFPDAAAPSRTPSRTASRQVRGRGSAAGP